MTIKHIKWPSIEQFRNVVKTVEMKSRYAGKDDNGDPIFNRAAKLPSLKFEGTVKLHGSNASVCLSPEGDFWAQSRTNIITPEDDNAGFAMFVKSREDDFKDLLCTAGAISRQSSNRTIVVYGEWCGGNIQKTVALNKLPKMFVIFGMARVDEQGNKTYLTRQQVVDACDGGREYVKKPSGVVPSESDIYCIYDFPTFDMEINFENPHESVETLNKITENVGTECPVGKAFGVSDIGEGVVWRAVEQGFEDSGFWFKVKDERHQNSKIKILAAVDVERINNIKELSLRLAHQGRLAQGMQEVFGINGEPDIKRTGEFIQWVMKDIFKEDIDIIVESGFNGKEINGPVSKIARDFLLTQLEV